MGKTFSVENNPTYLEEIFLLKEDDVSYFNKNSYLKNSYKTPYLKVWKIFETVKN